MQLRFTVLVASLLLALSGALPAHAPAAASPGASLDLEVFDWVQLQNTNPGGLNYYNVTGGVNGTKLDMHQVCIPSVGLLNGTYSVHVIIQIGNKRRRVDAKVNFINGDGAIQTGKTAKVVSVYVSTKR